MQNNSGFWLYLAVISLSTYLIRVIPFALVRKKITNRFIRSFLYYVPYTVLSAMTFPVAFYATGNIYAAASGVVIAIVLAMFNRGLTLVAVSSCATVFIVDQLIKYSLIL